MKEPRYGWVMVALGAFMTCIAVGAIFTGVGALLSAVLLRSERLTPSYKGA